MGTTVTPQVIHVLPGIKTFRQITFLGSTFLGSMYFLGAVTLSSCLQDLRPLLSGQRRRRDREVAAHSDALKRSCPV